MNALKRLALSAFMLCSALCATLFTPRALAQQNTDQPRADFSIALYYSTDIPWESLGAFDMVVVDPGNVTDAGWKHRLNPRTEVAAYVSVGEIHPSRPYFGQVNPAWKLGQNSDWGSVVLDQNSPEWRAFFVQRILAPLWAKGYRSFFLDTLDSFHLVAKTPQTVAAQTAGLVALVRDMKREFPQAKLIFNRGFEILPEVHTLAHAVAAESLFQGYDAGKKQFKTVPQGDFDWLWGQLKRCKDEYKLPVIGIDYVSANDRKLARETAQKIRDLGAIAWVATPELDSIGVGNVDIVSRQVLTLHDEPGHWAQVALHAAHRLAEMPLNQLGLSAELVASGSATLGRHTNRPLAGRYAGVVMWFTGGPFPTDPNVMALYERARAEGVPVVVLGAMPEAKSLARFDLEVGTPDRLRGNVVFEKGSPHVFPEFEPSAVAVDVWAGRLTRPLRPGTDVWLRTKLATGQTLDQVAVTAWGGYATARFLKVSLPDDKGERWGINPIEFFRAALRVDPQIPVPDVTTENGKRLLLIHIDGDGFPSRAEIPKTPLASEVMLTDFLQRYKLPTTVSIIQGEIAGNGLFKALSPQMEAIAKRIFALPHVELASHTYSHPFFWAEAELGLSRGSRAVGLKLPGYSFQVKAEIQGSADYINTQLAPPGKRTKMLLWSGDTQPLEEPLRQAYAAGLLNMNGGYTTISKTNPSLTLVAPLGIQKGEHFQVYAPNQNENVYTNDWTGPFYGFDHVIETFEMTDVPLRLKPVNLYYHTYIASKPASIATLHKVYRWIEGQDLHPVYASEYAQKVLDWRRATVARVVAAGTVSAVAPLELRSGGSQLKQWRVPASTPLVLNRSAGWAGQNTHFAQTYLSAVDAVLRLRISGEQTTQSLGNPDAMQLQSLNGKLLVWTYSNAAGQNTLTAQVFSHVPLKMALQGTCQFDPARSSTGLVAKKTSNNITHLETVSSGEYRVVFRCP